MTGNINFLENTTYVKKGVESEVVFTKIEMNNERLIFFKIQGMFQKVSRLKVYLPKQRWTMKANINFL